MGYKHASVATMLLGLIFACLLVSSTYSVFNNTYDEVLHIACGMEWLQLGRYTFEYQHPPIARIAIAIGPYLDGFRINPDHALWRDSFEFLYTGDYWRILTLSRVGNLVFLIQGGIFTFLWGRRWFSAWTGTLASLLFLALPPVLGHAGMATLDIACTSSMIAALYLFVRWRECSTSSSAAWAAAGFSYAFLCKFSNLAFLALSVLSLAPSLWEGLRSRSFSLKTCIRQAFVFCAVSFFLAFAVYRFHLGNLNDNIVTAGPEFKQSFSARITTLPPYQLKALERIIQVPLPILEIARGLREVATHNKKGHDNFLLGKFGTQGHWYFFPLVILLKTPPVFLLLLFVGTFLLLSNWSTSSWPKRLVLLSPCSTLLFCAFSDINIGIRHCLVVFPFFSLIAAQALLRLSEVFNNNTARLVVPALVLCGVFNSTLAAKPDFLAYFNILAGDKPEEVVVESDLDWGQDLERLSRSLAAKKVDSLHLAYFGTAQPSQHGLPPFVPLDRNKKVSGWVAISLRFLYLEHAKDNSYHWLKSYQPIERVGKSILIYHIDP